jgi:serine/threonine protein kinase
MVTVSRPLVVVPVCFFCMQLDNCLIDATRGAPLVKLCDFGYSKAENLGSGCKTACGTPEYMAPEVRRISSTSIITI